MTETATLLQTYVVIKTIRKTIIKDTINIFYNNNNDGNSDRNKLKIIIHKIL